MTEKSAKSAKQKKPRGLKKRELAPKTDLGSVLAGALIRLRERLDREDCRCDGGEAAGWCPLCAIEAASVGRASLAAEGQAAVANVVEDEDFGPEDMIEVRSALIHWIEQASDDEVEETFVEAIDIAEAG